MKLIVTILLVAVLCGCATNESLPPRYVWFCHIAGGGSCTVEMIRCWDRQHLYWTEAARCAAVAPKPDSLTNNQMWPPGGGTRPYPGMR